jgi:hypothetical protein
VERNTAKLITTEFLKMFTRIAGSDVPTIFKQMAKQMGMENPEAVAAGEETFREALASFFEKEHAEPTPEQLSVGLVQIRTFGPKLRNALFEVAKKLPVERSGRPRRLNGNEEAKLNMKIAELLSRGAEKTEAIKQAAAEFGVSFWTAKRSWKRYQEHEPSRRAQKRRRPTTRASPRG